MHMATSTKPWTRADLERFPDDGNRYEVLDGKLLVTPLPSIPHQGVATNLIYAIKGYCVQHSAGLVAAPGAVPNGDSELQPDIVVVLGVGMHDVAEWDQLPRPALVVEILSPSTQRYDERVKRDAYMRWGVAEYWIVDIEKREITLVRPGRDDERVVDTLRWHPRPEIPALEITIAEIFR